MREIRPKDFYLAQIIRQQERSVFELVEKLILNPEVLDESTIPQLRSVFNWATENLLDEKIFPVEKWLQTGFHLCKQRWDDSMDWLENQPISKILLMIDIVNQYAEDVSDAQKKAARGK